MCIRDRRISTSEPKCLVGVYVCVRIYACTCGVCRNSAIDSCFESFVPLLDEQLQTCFAQGASLTSCDVSYMRALVDSMWTRFGIVSPTLVQQMWTPVDRCGPNVDSMWTRFGIASKTRFHDLKQDIAKESFITCGPDVDAMWTRCGLASASFRLH